MSIAVKSVTDRIAAELNVAPWQVDAAIALLDGGATVPFVARYRKEATGGLDDTALRQLEERLRYLRELDERRAAIMDSIRQQGKLDEALETQLLSAETKARLEDIYLPYKPRRRTKAQIAREAGLEPLAHRLLSDPSQDPSSVAAAFVDTEKGVADVAAALDGARAIVIERVSEDADLVGEVRELMWQRGRLTAAARPGKDAEAAKFADYFGFSEAFTSLPSHRILALLRGEKEECLSLTFDPEPDPDGGTEGQSVYEQRIAGALGVRNEGRPGDRWLLDTVRWAWKTKLQVSSSIDVRSRLRHAAEADAVEVFARNVRDLLLSAPAGQRITMGLDPAYRTGVKVAVVDGTGKLLETTTVYPHKPQSRWDAALAVLGELVGRHSVDLIAIGNGTASRETDALAADLIKRMPDTKLTKLVVSEAGASVYSASEYAARELPQLDVSLRGAVSIARRLQDPLAELVKIDPKSLGVGQYQHDVSEGLLARSLDAIVEDAVNAVGVDVNTASVPLLVRVSGISPSIAENIVSHRDSCGRFASRSALKDVPRLGPKAYEQCAGFLRITDGDDPLDASAVHPEAYPVVRRIVSTCGMPVRELIGNSDALRTLRPSDFTDEKFGVPTVTDILNELDKPGRDPRPEFKAATFAEGVDSISDLKPGMVLEGVVTNVAAFGAFVDIGVHQDGLVHVSAMSSRFVSDPRDVVKSGDIVKVKVTSVDADRKRIGLTLRLDDDTTTRGQSAPRPEDRKPKGQGHEQRGGRGGQGAGQKSKQGRRDRHGKQGTRETTGSIAEALRRAGYTR
ncbi:RNA-binding transcriptional accessory protein [Hoyosella sp. YIM 151337]|uniref:Tex family protein n=1 Tax=Hoyosella sp. YIM 151337 TaxID=2992742 RepID=UPI002235B5A9|nr:Tex family protein [Hoyosella sp. YIM 151337]MCW4353946.1 RNA-binding transcriptional accessory protein [Hoyosella sp. YIM 151337]